MAVIAERFGPGPESHHRAIFGSALARVGLPQGLEVVGSRSWLEAVSFPAVRAAIISFDYLARPFRAPVIDNSFREKYVGTNMEAGRKAS
jgi:hypothetical protein